MARVLAVASSGGHLDQLILLRDAFDGHEVEFATTDLDQARAREVEGAHYLPDCNLDRPLRSLWCLFCAAWLIFRLRPDRIVTTGAAPGLFCILFGRIIGARTLWIDSVANAERLSLSGRFLSLRKIHSYSKHCATQHEKPKLS